jgi:ribulose 1,5-bisphosphate synthetase/thiazole synthase
MTHLPFWGQATGPLTNHVSHESLQDVTFDIVIIGSGITGTSCAYHILKQEPTKSVLIVETRTLCGGATGTEFFTA